MGLLDFISKNSSEGADETGTKVATKGHWIPRNDVDVEWVADKVCSRWENEPNFTIVGKSASEFREIVTLYISCRRQIASKENGSMSKTDRKNDLIVEMKKAFRILYSYIQEKIFPETNTDPYMRDFGFTKSGNSYVFPNDELERIAALEKLIEGVTNYGFTDKAFGLGYWQGIYDEYISLVENRDTTSSEKRVLVTKKNDNKNDVVKYLKAIKHMLTAVYDQSEKETSAALVNWGFKYFY